MQICCAALRLVILQYVVANAVVLRLGQLGSRSELKGVDLEGNLGVHVFKYGAQCTSAPSLYLLPKEIAYLSSDVLSFQPMICFLRL